MSAAVVDALRKKIHDLRGAVYAARSLEQRCDSEEWYARHKDASRIGPLHREILAALPDATQVGTSGFELYFCIERQVPSGKITEAIGANIWTRMHAEIDAIEALLPPPGQPWPAK